MQQSESLYSMAHADTQKGFSSWAARYKSWLRIQLTPKGIVLLFLKAFFLFFLQVVLCRDNSGSPVPLTKEAIKSAQLTYEGSFKDPEVLKHWSGSGNLR